MLKKINIIISIFCIFIATNGCKKYEEGPNLSFRSAKARASNAWRLESISIDGVEKVGLSQYRTQIQNWLGDGVYNMTFIDPASGVNQRVDGTWILTDNNKQVSIIENNTVTGVAGNSITYNILKLKNNSMWLRSVDSRIEAHLISL
jgi:hypothetical protein